MDDKAPEEWLGSIPARGDPERKEFARRDRERRAELVGEIERSR